MKSICNFRYTRAKGGTTQFPDVRGLLKYVQYRDDRDDHILGGGGPDRWVDGGLGSSYPTILARLDELSAGNPHAYCFSIVISPDPEAIAAWRSGQETQETTRVGLDGVEYEVPGRLVPSFRPCPSLREKVQGKSNDRLVPKPRPVPLRWSDDPYS